MSDTSYEGARSRPQTPATLTGDAIAADRHPHGLALSGTQRRCVGHHGEDRGACREVVARSLAAAQVAPLHVTASRA